MNIFNYTISEYLKKNKTVLFYMIIIFIFYFFSVKYLRPYSYENYPEFKYFNFILGVVPNLLGTILIYLMYNCLLEFSKIKSVISTMAIVLFMETERYFYEGKAFDVYDIVASIIAIAIVFLLQSSSLKKLKAF